MATQTQGIAAEIRSLRAALGKLTGASEDDEAVMRLVQ